MMYIDSLSISANSDRFDVNNPDRAFGNKREFYNFLNKNNRVKDINREIRKVSPKRQSREIANNSEVTALEKNQYGKKFKADVGGGKVTNDEKLPLQWKNNEIFSIFQKDNWDMIKSEERGSESNRSIDLLNILGIKNNESSKNSDFSNSLGILKLDSAENINVKNIISQITDYLIQNGIKKMDFLEVIVDHEDLGRFKIDVQKAGGKGQIDMRIEVMSVEGKDFFQKNEALLAKNLARVGINIQDLKIIESKENILSSSFLSKNDNMALNLEEDIPNDKNNRNRDRDEGHEKNERYYRPRDQYMNEEENDAQYR